MKLMCLCTKLDFYDTKEFYKIIIFSIEFLLIMNILNQMNKSFQKKTLLYLECNEIA